MRGWRRRANFGDVSFLTLARSQHPRVESTAVRFDRFGAEPVLLAEMIWGMYLAAVVESVASKPAPFKNRRGAAPDNSKTFVWAVWKGRPPALS